MFGAGSVFCGAVIGILSNGVDRTLKKLHTSKGDYSIKAVVLFNCNHFKVGTTLKGKNLLPEGANSFLLE